MTKAMEQVTEPKPNEEEPVNGLYFAELVIPNKKGLHARASAQFVRCAASYTATVRVTREGHTVLGTSIMGLMMLAAGPGTTVTVSALGPDAEAAITAITELVESKFNEEGT